MIERIQYSIARIILAVIGILVFGGFYCFVANGFPLKLNSIIIGSITVIFAAAELFFSNVVKSCDDMQNTKEFNAREYDLLVENLKLYKRLALSTIALNILLKMVSSICAAILLLSAEENLLSDIFGLVGYIVLGWSAAWLFYIFRAYQNVDHVRTHLAGITRNADLAKSLIGQVATPKVHK